MKLRCNPVCHHIPYRVLAKKQNFCKVCTHRQTRGCGGMVDALDLKSKGLNKPCRFESCHPHHLAVGHSCQAVASRPTVRLHSFQQETNCFKNLAVHPLRGGIRAKPWLLAPLLGFIVSSKRLIVSSTSRCDPLRGGIRAKPWLLAQLLDFIVFSKRLIVSSTLRAPCGATPCGAAFMPSVMPPPTVKPHNFSEGLIEPIPLFEMKTGEVAACPQPYYA